MNRIAIGLSAAVFCIALSACSSSPTPAPEPDEDSGVVTDSGGSDSADLGSTDTGSDPGVEDVEVEVDAGPGSDYGAPCRRNTDCESGFCVPGPQGLICTRNCVDECEPAGEVSMDCSPVLGAGADATRVCLPVGSGLCSPCLDDLNCVGGACVQTPDGGVCGLHCQTADDCPAFTTCFSNFNGEPLPTPQCLPDTGSCSCSEESAGEIRPCVRSDEDMGAVCVGVETCDPTRGWSDCDALYPIEERCDGFDNDCDGLIDEELFFGADCVNENEFGLCPGAEVCGGIGGLTCDGDVPEEEVCDLADNNCNGVVDDGLVDADGIYFTDSHCGACGNDCGDRFPDGIIGGCEVIDGVAQCVVLGCPPGTAPAGRFACIPLDSALCSPCGTADDCNSAVGDGCVNYGDFGRFCGRDCSPDSAFGSDCPTGFACDEGQCRRTLGNCGCEAGDLFFLPCSIEGPGGLVCGGTQQCDDGTLSRCEAPAEVCNGFDDDCDGELDEGFVDGAGVPDQVEHCGRCYNDCNALFSGGNASGACVEGLCVPTCIAGFADADGLEFNGCECEVLSEFDEPDPAGIDANCDGIDGDLARSVFVAPWGSDGATGTIDDPLLSIEDGIAMAVPGTIGDVLVSAGVYEESVVLREGVSVHAGYSADFRVRDIAGNETAVLGQAQSDGRRGAISAHGIVGATTRVSGLTIVGADAVEFGQSSYAVHITESGDALVFTNNVIRAGRGGPGVSGGSGGSGLDAASGSPTFVGSRAGGAARDAGGECPASPVTSVAGGAGASFTCASPLGGSSRTDGGAGGTAGCPDPDRSEPAGRAGNTTPGSSGSTAGGAGGGGGTSLRLWSTNAMLPPSSGCDLCIVPSGPTDTITGQLGRPGDRGQNGLAGGGCSGGVGSATDGRWVNEIAAPGGLGGPGSGGGGGGAGGGWGHCLRPDCAVTDERVCFGNDQIGGGGGGGGAGGCGGTGGTGGGGGGGSFAVFIYYASAPVSLPVFADNRVERGIGGPGGAGGPGGIGGEGSDGSSGSPSALGCTGIGGAGGAGGPGGPGGGGGGGCGGIAVGFWVGGPAASSLPAGLSTSALSASNGFAPTGSGGVAGEGGPSAGLDGANASDGLYEPVLPCAAGGGPPCP